MMIAMLNESDNSNGKENYFLTISNGNDNENENENENMDANEIENAHANSVEGYAVFVAGVVSFLSLSFDFSLLLLRLVDFPCDEFCEKMLTDLLS